MFIALTNSALSTFTGYLGTLEFRDGISIDSASRRDCERIKAITAIEIIDSAPKLISQEIDGNEVSIKVEGAGVRYEWFCEKESIVKTSSNHFVLPDNRMYRCLVSNSMGALEPLEFQTKQTKASLEKVDSTNPEINTESEIKKALFEREELEKIADELGISGLRELASKHGIKGRSIQEIIDEMLALKA